MKKRLITLSSTKGKSPERLHRELQRDPGQYRKAASSQKAKPSERKKRNPANEDADRILVLDYVRARPGQSCQEADISIVTKVAQNRVRGLVRFVPGIDKAKLKAGIVCWTPPERVALPNRVERELKLTAALYAQIRGVLEHIRATGRLPKKINAGGAHIGMRLLIERRSTDITLTPDEQLVYDAIIRGKRLPGGSVILSD